MEDANVIPVSQDQIAPFKSRLAQIIVMEKEDATMENAIVTEDILAYHVYLLIQIKNALIIAHLFTEELAKLMENVNVDHITQEMIALK